MRFIMIIVFCSNKYKENSDKPLLQNTKFFLSQDYTVFTIGLSIIFGKKVILLNF